MTPVQLRHLIALAEGVSFSRAAELTHVTQPALWHGVRALEDEPGATLFDRLGKRAEATPIGRDALQRARQLVLETQELQEGGRARSTGQQGTLRVAMGSAPPRSRHD